MNWRGSFDGFYALIQASAPTRYEMWIHDTSTDALTVKKPSPRTNTTHESSYDGLQRENAETCDPSDLKIHSPAFLTKDASS